VEPDPSVRGLLEAEREGVEQCSRPQPEITVAAGGDDRAVGSDVTVPQRAVDAVGRNDEVGVREHRGIGDLALVLHSDAELHGPGRQGVQQRTTTDRIPVAAEMQGISTADPHVLVTPPNGRGGDDSCADRVGAVQLGEQALAEHDPPAVRHSSRVPLDHRDVAPGESEPGQGCEVQARRPAADAHDPHLGDPLSHRLRHA
jgi:hypothetical protein